MSSDKTYLPHLRGEAMEQFACDRLIANGLKLVQKNYRTRLGEIDLIMRDGEYLVFIEVRYRQNTDHGCPLESITPQKQRRIVMAAQIYLQNKNLTDKVPVRFDVLAITGETKPKWTWIKQAIDLF